MSAHKRLQTTLARLRRRVRRVSASLDFGERRRDAAVNTLRQRFFPMLWSETAAAIGARIEDVGYGFYRISRDARTTFVRQSDVMLDDHVSLRIAGNKPLVYKLLAEHTYIPPRHAEFDLATLETAERFRREIGGPVVVKPASGTGGGSGVTTNIQTRRALRRAAFFADAFGDGLMVEEQLPGACYRLLYLDGELIDAIRREPPRVTGNGTHTIRTLINAENRRRVRADPPVALSLIAIDADCRAKLRTQHCSLAAVPRDGEVVVVKQVVNQNSASENHVVREEVHPSVVKLGQRLVVALGLRLAGVDVLSPDISLPLSDSGGAITDINTTPGLHHHVLVADAHQRAAVPAIVLERILSRQRSRGPQEPDDVEHPPSLTALGHDKRRTHS